MGNRIGFLLANFKQGSGAPLFRFVVEEALKNKNDALFVFPGGRLNYAPENEHLSNSIYSLANKENLDGAIVWASSLTGSVSAEESSRFVKNIAASIPVVSMCQKIEGIPSVDFDAYTGIYNLVQHLIDVHGLRRIAFLRGPESHESAERRFKAYKDALRDNHIEYNESLVTNPHTWGEGEEAIKELIEQRHLTPGVDFDTLLAPSDHMLFKAVKYLEARGVIIPDGLRTAGFNDSEENNLNSVAATTVKMPMKGLVSKSYEKISLVLSGREELISDEILPSEMILRQSCGCKDSFGGETNARKVIKNSDDFKHWLKKNIDNETAYLALLTIIENVYVKQSFMRSERIRDLLDQYFSGGGSASLLLESFKWAEHILSLSIPDRAMKDRLFSIIVEQLVRSDARKNYEKEQVTKRLNTFKNMLLSVSTIDELIEVINSTLPPLGVERAYLALYKDDDYTLFKGGFNEHGAIRCSREFHRSGLIADDYLSGLDNGVFVIEPLNYLSQELGYLIIKTSNADGYVLEDIRSSISSSLKGISLFEVEAKRSENAERAERELNEFYSNLSEGLREPLDAILSLAKEKAIDKDALIANVVKAEHLLELSMTEKGGVELKKELTPPSLLANALNNAEVAVPEELPSLLIDTTLLSDAINILIGFITNAGDSAKVHFSAYPSYFYISIGSKGNKWKPTMLSDDPSRLLFEKIVLMHSGSFRFTSSEIGICLPYPSLSGLSQIGSSNGKVLFITSGDKDEVPHSLDGFDVVKKREDELIESFAFDDEVVSILWSSATPHKEKSIILNLLKNYKDTKDLPFLFFGLKSPTLSLVAALELTTPRQDKAMIISAGKFPESLSRLSEFGTVVELESASRVVGIEEEAALIILYEYDADVINRIRSSKRFIRTPILITKDTILINEAEELKEVPNVLIVNTSILESEEFISRLISIFGGGELLPPLTSALVKKSIAYLNKNASLQISRWQLAAAVNISEDYLTRIFRKEIGISPWDYLNRYRIQLASKMLTQTGASVNEIARDIGFQDQAYFCRVFKKVKGFPPGHLRVRN